MKRSELYSREDETPYRERVIRDQQRAKAEGWTHVGVSFIPEPPIPMGVPPVGHPRRAESDEIGGVIPLPDYEAGEA